MIGAKPLCIRFNKIDVFIRVCNGTRFLALFKTEKYDVIYNRTRYLISQKRRNTYVISHNYAKIKVDSYNSLPPAKNIGFAQCYNTL